jgi:hypothetical protein
MTGNNRNTQAGQKGHAKRQNKKKNSNNQNNNMPKSNKTNVGNVVSMASVLSVMNSNSNYRKMNNKVVTLSGSDFLGRVSVAPTPDTVSTAVRRTFPISPSAYPGTRLTQLSELWERYRFRKFSIRYVPSVPNTLACQVLVYQDTDPLDDPLELADVDSLIRQGVSQTGSQQWNFNTPKVVALAKRADKELYYTGLTKQNERFNYQGTAYLVQVTDAIDFNGGTLPNELDCGSLYIDWECEFQTPQINPSAVQAGLGEVVRPPAASRTEVFDALTTDTITVPAGYKGVLGLSEVVATTADDYLGLVGVDLSPGSSVNQDAFEAFALYFDHSTSLLRTVTYDAALDLKPGDYTIIRTGTDVGLDEVGKLDLTLTLLGI